jgi:hypothetical protein
MVHIDFLDGSTKSHSHLDGVSVFTDADIRLNMAYNVFFWRHLSAAKGYRVIKVFSGVQNVQIIDYSKTKNMSLTGITFLAVRCFQICCFSFEPAFAVIKEKKVQTCSEPSSVFCTKWLVNSQFSIMAWSILFHSTMGGLLLSYDTRGYTCSRPDEVDFLNWRNPSGRTMTLGSTQLLTEMSTRNLKK